MIGEEEYGCEEICRRFYILDEDSLWLDYIQEVDFLN